MSSTASQIDFEKLASTLASFSFASRAVIKRYFRQPIAIEGKADDSPVTIADKQAEQVLREAVMAAYPAHNIVGEEQGGVISGKLDWVIDPIDGTRAFICGKPQFGTLVALCDALVPIAGMIDMPIMDERYSAVKGQGAFCNDEPISVSGITDIARARIASTAPEALDEMALVNYDRLAARCLTASWGGDCYNYALLAAGHIDLVVEHSLANHDIMALVPVIEEAGGIITDWQGGPVRLGKTDCLIAAASDDLHQQAMAEMSVIIDS